MYQFCIPVFPKEYPNIRCLPAWANPHAGSCPPVDRYPFRFPPTDLVTEYVTSHNVQIVTSHDIQIDVTANLVTSAFSQLRICTPLPPLSPSLSFDPVLLDDA